MRAALARFASAVTRRTGAFTRLLDRPATVSPPRPHNHEDGHNDRGYEEVDGCEHEDQTRLELVLAGAKRFEGDGIQTNAGGYKDACSDEARQTALGHAKPTGRHKERRACYEERNDTGDTELGGQGPLPGTDVHHREGCQPSSPEEKECVCRFHHELFFGGLTLGITGGRSPSRACRVRPIHIHGAITKAHLLE